MRPRNKKFRSIYLEFTSGIRAWDTLVVFEVKRNISQTGVCLVSGDLLTPLVAQIKHEVSQKAETELSHPFRADSRARAVRAHASDDEISQECYLIFKEN